MRLVKHPNVVDLRAFFYSNGDKVSSGFPFPVVEVLANECFFSVLLRQPKKDEVYLNLVLEYVPETVYRASRHYAKLKQTMPMHYIKLYMYQLLRSLAYIHLVGICHRDIKPQNLLLNPPTGVLKLCDFGSAKILVEGEPNVSYICSRYYRAPELIFGATNYTTNIGRYFICKSFFASLLTYFLLPCHRCVVFWMRYGGAYARPTVVSGRVRVSCFVNPAKSASDALLNAFPLPNI